MELHITFRQMKSSDAVKAYVEEKLQKLDKYKDKATDAHVILSVESYRHVAEINFSAKQFQSTGKSETEDMYKSIDEALALVEKQLKKHHAKKTKAKVHPAAL